MQPAAENAMIEEHHFIPRRSGAMSYAYDESQSQLSECHLTGCNSRLKSGEDLAKMSHV